MYGPSYKGNGPSYKGMDLHTRVMYGPSFQKGHPNKMFRFPLMRVGRSVGRAKKKRNEHMIAY